MSRVEPETSHRRLQNVKFLGDADLELFADLKNRVLGLLEPDEKITLSDANAADAWSQTFHIYKKLQKRRDAAETPEQQVFRSQSAADEREWNEYLQQRVEFMEWLNRESISADVREYIGLRSDDLDSPVMQGDDAMRFGNPRHPDWRGRAGRISTAMWKLKNMGIPERMNIPNILQIRRLVDAINSFGEKLKTFEDKLGWLDGRLAAVESKSIDRTNKH